MCVAIVQSSCKIIGLLELNLVHTDIQTELIQNMFSIMVIAIDSYIFKVHTNGARLLQTKKFFQGKTIKKFPEEKRYKIFCFGEKRFNFFLMKNDIKMFVCGKTK